MNGEPDLFPEIAKLVVHEWQAIGCFESNSVLLSSGMVYPVGACLLLLQAMGSTNESLSTETARKRILEWQAINYCEYETECHFSLISSSQILYGALFSDGI